MGCAESENRDWKKEERGAEFEFHVLLAWYGIGRSNIAWNGKEKSVNPEDTEFGAQRAQRRGTKEHRHGCLCQRELGFEIFEAFEDRAYY